MKKILIISIFVFPISIFLGFCIQENPQNQFEPTINIFDNSINDYSLTNYTTDSYSINHITNSNKPYSNISTMSSSNNYTTSVHSNNSIDSTNTNEHSAISLQNTKLDIEYIKSIDKPFSVAPKGNYCGQPAFVWTRVENAQYYDLEISSSPDFTQDGNSPDFYIKYKLSTYYITPQEKLIDGIYYWRVRAGYNEDIYSEWTTTSVTNIYELPEIQNLQISPINETYFCFVDRPLFKWKDLGIGFTYDIQITSKSDINYDNPIIINNLPYTSSWEYTYPFSQGIYKWRMKVKRNLCETDWTEDQIFYIQMPNKPYLKEPDGFITDKTPTFSWNKTDLDLYISDLEISTDTNFSAGNIVLSKTDIENDNYTFLSDLKCGDTYYWRVKQKNGSCMSEWSYYKDFSINYNGDSPSVDKPMSNYSNCANNIEFSWIYNENQYDIELQITDYSDKFFETPLYSITPLTDTRYNPGTLPSGNYLWRIRVDDGTCDGPWVGNRGFSVGKPTPPETFYPFGIIDKKDFNFQWRYLIDNNAKYGFQLSTDSEFSGAGIIDQDFNNPLNKYKTDYELTYGTYYWRVKGYLENCESDWSEPVLLIIDRYVPGFDCSTKTGANYQNLSWIGRSAGSMLQHTYIFFYDALATLTDANITVYRYMGCDFSPCQMEGCEEGDFYNALIKPEDVPIAQSIGWELYD